MDSVATRALAALDRLGVTEGVAALVACSGGSDSVALAHVARALAERGRLGRVAVAHVDHGLRPDSADDADFVRELAGELDLECAVETVSVEPGDSLEAAARQARYAALDRMADRAGAELILVGHTRRDQAETVLMRILRGTGVVGLGGIPARRGRIVRPLIDIEHQEVRDYCQRHGLRFREDPMNRDRQFFRVRVREHWLPELAGENPAVTDALIRLARSAAEVRVTIEYASSALARAARSADPGGARVYRSDALAQAPGPVRAHLFQTIAAELAAGPLTSSHIEDLEDLLSGPAAGSRSVDLPGMTVIREYDRLRFAPASAPTAEDFTDRLDVTGPDGPYEVRTWRPGDRMKPARLAGRSRKLSDLFIDAKIPRRLRSRARVVIRRVDGEIVWAEHLGYAHGARADVTLTPLQPLATNR